MSATDARAAFRPRLERPLLLAASALAVLALVAWAESGA